MQTPCITQPLDKKAKLMTRPELHVWNTGADCSISATEKKHPLQGIKEKLYNQKPGQVTSKKIWTCLILKTTGSFYIKKKYWLECFLVMLPRSNYSMERRAGREALKNETQDLSYCSASDRWATSLSWKSVVDKYTLN